MAPPPLDTAERQPGNLDRRCDRRHRGGRTSSRRLSRYDQLRLRGDPRHCGRDRCTIGLDPALSPDQRVHVMEREPRRRRESPREPRFAGPADPDDDDSVAVERVLCADRRHPETRDSLHGPCPRARADLHWRAGLKWEALELPRLPPRQRDRESTLQLATREAPIQQPRRPRDSRAYVATVSQLRPNASKLLRRQPDRTLAHSSMCIDLHE
jgi:hypothetical protein